MALKDWKKTQNNLWENKKNKDMLKIGGSIKWGYDVKLGKYHPYLIQMKEIGTFKTKSKALAYAKSYMKKH